MASSLITALLFVTFIATVTASDPDIITDFVVPANLTKIDGDFFTFTALRGFFDSDHPPNFKVTEAGMADSQNPATAISASGSANAGTVSVPTTVFATGIDDNILAKALKTDVATIQKLKAGLAVKA
ncbi:germin-like protein 9-3 [Populus alba]|uniref:Germin-like protein 9-3 n=1 Tax=Populus alba x Populus x berolinensis TaxID=444605 RepID=A0AAD6MG31_9ROSI|nr:germin-like protein 9-3 [Populus alba]KAJ6983642.1 germin-like protein 9-3 [Populus alba x Populus x berolinensis]